MKRLSDEEKARLQGKIEQGRANRTHRIVKDTKRKNSCLRSLYFREIKLVVLVLIGSVISCIAILVIPVYVVPAERAQTLWPCIFWLSVAMMLTAGIAGIVLDVRLVRRLDRIWKKAICIIALLIFLCVLCVYGFFCSFFVPWQQEQTIRDPLAHIRKGL